MKFGQLERVSGDFGVSYAKNRYRILALRIRPFLNKFEQFCENEINVFQQQNQRCSSSGYDSLKSKMAFIKKFIKISIQKSCTITKTWILQKI
jgi:hypothetical protein